MQRFDFSIANATGLSRLAPLPALGGAGPAPVDPADAVEVDTAAHPAQITPQMRARREGPTRGGAELSMHVSPDVRRLLEVPQQNGGGLARFEASAETAVATVASTAVATTRAPLSADERARLLSQRPGDLLRQYVELRHSASMRSLPQREDVLRRWTLSVLRDLKSANVSQHSLDRMAFAFDAMRDASVLLERRMRRALTDIGTQRFAQRMQRAGVTADEVIASLDRHSRDVLHELEREAIHGTVVLPLVPSERQLLDDALRAAQQAHAAGAAEFKQEKQSFSALPPVDTPSVQVAALLTPIATDLPVIGNRAQALQALKEFETGRTARLPQLSQGGGATVHLALGIVHFLDMRDLVATFPCASIRLQDGRDQPGVHNEADQPVPDTVYAPGYTQAYPAGRGVPPPTRAYVSGQHVVTARLDVQSNNVRLSTDFEYWRGSDVYTDDTVEAEKLALWDRISHEAFRLSLGVDIVAEDPAGPPV